MAKLTIQSLILTLLFTVISCSTINKIDALKPEPDDATPLIYESNPSFINMPVSVKLKDIENQTNSLLNGLIYEDNNIEDDDIEMKVWKLAPITINNKTAEKGNKITTVLPLKATVKYRVGTKKMGIELYDTREFQLNGLVTLVSDVTLINWNLATKTELKSLNWNENPTMTVFGKNMPITYLINPTIKIFKSKIESKIDESISKSMDFKPNVLMALEKISAPLRMSEEYNTWLRVTPLEIYSTNARLKNDTFILEMGMKCTMETIVGQKPESKFNGSKIIVKSVSKIPENVIANIVAISNYSEASKIMTKNFIGQEFGSGSKKVKVEKVTIWHKAGKMIIALDLLGSVNGTVYLSGFPKYNNQTKEIYFEQLDYVLNTKNKLMRTANWLAESLILKKIEQNCRYSIQPNLAEGQKNMMSYLKNYSPMKGVFINGKMNDIQFKKFQLTNQAIIAFLQIGGDVKVSVNGL
ncbi:hypothetical protein RCH18_000008 [Flavobacterium sp. PL11]|jgi:hypothetical protein|uniref:DUF4403 family protein n=1 Tax=Flavobacterium sp. PL11 TaxID=3071717 RepID=UPI002E09C823|nr:hypothetical protein [Flavobacterium sp. PL11]